LRASRTVFATLFCGLILILFNGSVNAQTLWTTNGIPICIDDSVQTDVHIVSDDSAGAIIVWTDYRYGSADLDIYAQRINTYGDTLWDSNGKVVIEVLANQNYPYVISDGTGGAIIAWRDYRDDGDGDVYVQNIDANGNYNWAALGVPVCTDTTEQIQHCLASDDSGGVFLAWRDARNGADDIYAQRVNASGDTLWPANGVPICTATNTQYDPRITADGFGGAIISWADARNGIDYDIYAQRIDASGDTLWPANGVPICTAAEYQFDPQIANDNLGGAYIVWQDDRGAHYDIYAQRVDGDGNTLWLPDGIPICTASNAQYCSQIITTIYCTIITWEDCRGGSWDIYAQGIDANGNALGPADGLLICGAADDQRAPQIVNNDFGGTVITWQDRRSGYKWDIYAQWIDTHGDTLMPAGGFPICNAMGDQTSPCLIEDDLAGAIIAWTDGRSNSTIDVYTQKVSFDPAPHITSIADVPGDQGRQVAILWAHSYLDDAEYRGITEYSIWRKDPGSSKSESPGQEWDGRSAEDLTPGMYRFTERPDGSGGTKQEYWEYIDAIDAHYLEGYRYAAPTLDDSSAGGTPYFTFMVSAHTADPFIFYDSAPDSGYSVDDISPAKTQMNIAHGGGKDTKGSLQLSWEQVTTGADGSPETGPIQYNVYCDTTAWFTPGAGNLLTSTPNLSYPHSDARIGDPQTNLFYLVTAADGSDNESEQSNHTGEYDYDVKTTTGTDYTWIAFCLGDTSITMASHLEAYIESHSSPATNCLTISEWNPTAQTYTHYTTIPIPMGDFALQPGRAYRVEVTTDAVWTLVGDVLPADSVSFDLKTTTGTDYTWISLPMNLDGLAMASNLETHIQSNSSPTTDCLTISEWNPTAQTYTHYTTIPIPMGDFAIRPGRAYRVEVTADAVWP
jgi:hypothetical protein